MPNTIRHVAICSTYRDWACVQSNEVINQTWGSEQKGLSGAAGRLAVLVYRLCSSSEQ